jgi:hypothetical protein
MIRFVVISVVFVITGLPFYQSAEPIVEAI